MNRDSENRVAKVSRVALVCIVVCMDVFGCQSEIQQSVELVQQVSIECSFDSDLLRIVADTSYDDFRIVDTELETSSIPLHLRFKFQHDGKYYRWKEVRIETLPWIEKRDFILAVSAIQTGEKLYEVIREWIDSQ